MSDRIKELNLASTESFRKSLEALKTDKAKLSEKRKRMLKRVGEQNTWDKFELNSINSHDLAYLTAFSGDEFALLRGKHEDILLHGTKIKCKFEGQLYEDLRKGKYRLIVHSHPGEIVPSPSFDDRKTLKIIGQYRSKIISGISGIEIDFTQNPFEI